MLVLYAAFYFYSEQKPRREQHGRFDVIGATALAIGLAALTLAMPLRATAWFLDHPERPDDDSLAADACRCCAFECLACGWFGIALAVSCRVGYSLLRIIPGESDQCGKF